MSPDINGFLNNVKRAAVEAVEAKKPFALVFGEVISVSPLMVGIDQKLKLTEAQLILTSAVRDFTIFMTVSHETQNALGSHSHSYSGKTETAGRESHSHGYSGETEKEDLTHSHSYEGKKEYFVHNGLKAGERVLLLRANGGQKYIILDRVEAPS